MTTTQTKYWSTEHVPNGAVYVGSFPTGANKWDVYLLGSDTVHHRYGNRVHSSATTPLHIVFAWSECDEQHRYDPFWKLAAQLIRQHLAKQQPPPQLAPTQMREEIIETAAKASYETPDDNGFPRNWSDASDRVKLLERRRAQAALQSAGAIEPLTASERADIEAERIANQYYRHTETPTRIGLVRVIAAVIASRDAKHKAELEGLRERCANAASLAIRTNGWTLASVIEAIRSIPITVEADG